MDDAFEQNPDYTDPVEDMEEDMEVEPPSRLALLPVFFSWRSLGGYLNYENWPERERFLELDQAIAVIQARQREAALWAAGGFACHSGPVGTANRVDSVRANLKNLAPPRNASGARGAIVSPSKRSTDRSAWHANIVHYYANRRASSVEVAE
jgi:hypothetical protein